MYVFILLIWVSPLSVINICYALYRFSILSKDCLIARFFSLLPSFLDNPWQLYPKRYNFKPLFFCVYNWSFSSELEQRVRAYSWWYLLGQRMLTGEVQVFSVPVDGGSMKATSHAALVHLKTSLAKRRCSLLPWCYHCRPVGSPVGRQCRRSVERVPYQWWQSCVHR